MAIKGHEQGLLDFTAEGDLPMGVNIEKELERAMEEHGGTVQYWHPGAEAGTTEGFSRDYFQRKFDHAVDILQSKTDINPIDIEKSQNFIDEVFGIYEGVKEPYRRSESFSFVATTRISRVEEEEFVPCDYRKETIGAFPILKYTDISSAQRLFVGVPPFVLDYYGEDHQGGGGVMIYSPLFLDLLKDSGDRGIEVAMNVARETSWFAKERLGVKLLSLAALLPKHTGYGMLYQYPGIETTTGHGGTTWLIGEVVKKALDEARVASKLSNKIGVLGVGGIGSAVADLLAREFPDLQIGINDHDAKRMREVGEQLRTKYKKNHIVDLPNAAEVLRYGGITVSAITKAIDLEQIGLKEGELEGRVYVDDSQPAAIAAEQVEHFGGLHVGVIAQDNTDFGVTTGRRFNYGGMGPKDLSQAYGCAMEGASLFYGDGLEAVIQQPVDGDRVRQVAEYCKSMGFTAAALQTLKDGKAVSV